MGKKRDLTSIVLMVIIVVGGLTAGIYLYSDLLRGTKAGSWLESAKKPSEGKSEATSEKQPPGERKVLYWVDAMNPSRRYNKPGKAPDGMDLVPVYAEEGTTAAEKPKEERKVLYWVDAMNPSRRYDKPGKAPDGMDLVPVYAEEGPEAGGAMPPGTVKVTAQRQQLIGVAYGDVTEHALTRAVWTVGRLVYDETRIARIQTKIEGWIDKVFVDFTGQLVKKNQPLISIYSPELVSTQQELLIAKKLKNSLGKSEYAEFGLNASSLYTATLERLRLWNISDQQVREIEKRGSPMTTLTLFSPVEGFVLTRNAFPGQRVSAETELYSVADLSSIWVMADVYEYEAPYIRVGQPATMTLSYFPGQAFRGRVTYINPQLDNVARTLKVRIEFPNPGFKLKPDMYANVELEIDYGRRISVPEGAVLNAGREQMVFVDRGDGYLEPRKVELGAMVDNRYIVLKGLKAGERIVTSGNFLIDSESRLKSATAGMAGPEGATGGGHAGHGTAAPQEGDGGKTEAPLPQPQTGPDNKGDTTDHSKHTVQPPAPQPSPADHSKHQTPQ